RRARKPSIESAFSTQQKNRVPGRQHVKEKINGSGGGINRRSRIVGRLFRRQKGCCIYAAGIDRHAASGHGKRSRGVYQTSGQSPERGGRDQSDRALYG